MKKLICLMLVLTLALSAAAGALALSAVPFPSDTEESSVYFRCLCTVGDTLYMLADSDRVTLYAWTENDGLSRLILPSGDDRVSVLFSDGGRLLTIDQENGTVCELKLDDEDLSLEELVAIDGWELFQHVEDDWNYVPQPNGCGVIDGHLLWLVQDWDSVGYPLNRLLDLDLSSGKARKIDIADPQVLILRDDGRANVLCRDEENAWDEENERMIDPTLRIYDPATGEVQEIGSVPINDLSSTVWNDTLGAMIYVSGGRIQAAYDDGTAIQVGFTPLSYVSALCPFGEDIAMSDGNSVYLREISESFNAEQYLVVSGGFWMDGRTLFCDRYPDIPVYESDVYYSYETPDKVLEALKGGEMDVLVIDLSWNSTFTTLRDRGYFLDLSADAELAGAVENMWPVYTADLWKDGKLAGVPIIAGSYSSWFASKNVMETMGLTEEDIPHSWPELIAFCNRWVEEYADEYPDYLPVEAYGDSIRGVFMEWIVNSYMDTFAARGEEVRFDTPLFRELMDALDTLDAEGLDRLIAQGSDEDSWRESLMMYGYPSIGSFDITNDEWQIYCPFTIGGEPCPIGVNLTVMMINPWSTHQEAAVNLLHCFAESMGTYSQYVLYADRNQPVENPDFERMKANEEGWLTELRESLAVCTDEEERISLEESIESSEAYLSTIEERYFYTISQEEIDIYRDQLLPLAFVAKPTFTSYSEENSDSELKTLLQRYVDRQINTDQFIREADGKLRMMQLERE